MKKSLVILAACFLAQLAAPSITQVRADETVYNVRSDDPKMIAAVDKARSELPKFIWVVKNPHARRSMVSIKVKFQEGEIVEYMWVDDLKFDGKVFRGFLANVPTSMKSFKQNDKIVAEPANVADWMWVENGKLVGGYTVRVIRSKLSKKDRLKFDKDLGYKID